MVPSMEQSMPFSEVLEAVDRLSLDEQQVLLDVISHRMNEASRRRIASEIQEADKEFTEGRCVPTTAEQIMDEIKS
jgi:hypothetical protein